MDIQSASTVGRHAYRAIFFDLDGTLLPVDIHAFLKKYFKAIEQFVVEHKCDGASFSAGLQAAIKAMATHDDDLLNSEVFWTTFSSHVRGTTEEWMALVNQFYEHDFARLGTDIKADPASEQAISILRSKGYPLFLTTMPLFPRRAIAWRLAWAGLDPSLFKRITSYENSTSVKPKLRFFAENLAAGRLAGPDVLMVGNNTVEDLSAQKLGTDAYLVTDTLLDPTNAFVIYPLKHGSLSDFAEWAHQLPVCANPVVSVEEGPVGKQGA